MKTPRTTRAALAKLACALAACSTAPEQPPGPPVAVQDDRIVFLGTDADVGRWQGVKTRVVDLHGQMMMPGLVDAHVHAFGVVQPDVCDLQNRPMPLAALDAASTDHPILVFGSDGHHGAASILGLAQARTADGRVLGHSRATLEKEFRDIRERVAVDATGEPSGGLTESAKARLGAAQLAVVFTHARTVINPTYDLSVIPFFEPVRGRDLYNPAGAFPGALHAAQQLDVFEAIASHTIDAARVLGMENEIGSLELGKKADMIVLDQNIVGLAKMGEAKRISDTRVEQVVFDGKEVLVPPVPAAEEKRD
jgi:predicted amidohydrolase YtcJ